MEAQNSSDAPSSSVRRELKFKAEAEILTLVLPALQQAIENVTNFIYEPDVDDEEIHDHLHELATETVIDELVRLLTRDTAPVSSIYMVKDVDGIGIDTLIACYGELAPANARAWYAHLHDMTAEEYDSQLLHLPEQLDL